MSTSVSFSLDNMTKDEEVVAALAAQKHPEAFRPIYEKYLPLLLQYVYRRVLDQQIAEDIVGDVFVKALKSIPAFRDQGYGVSAWLYRIAHHQIVDFVRRRNILPVHSLSEMEGQIVDRAPTVDQQVMIAEAAEMEQARFKQIVGLIDRLSEEDQQLITLKYFDEKTNEEIAQIIDLDKAHVAVKTHRAMAKLRKRYEEVFADATE